MSSERHAALRSIVSGPYASCSISSLLPLSLVSMLGSDDTTTELTLLNGHGGEPEVAALHRSPSGEGLKTWPLVDSLLTEALSSPSCADFPLLPGALAVARTSRGEFLIVGHFGVCYLDAKGLKAPAYCSFTKANPVNCIHCASSFAVAADSDGQVWQVQEVRRTNEVRARRIKMPWGKKEPIKAIVGKSCLVLVRDSSIDILSLPDSSSSSSSSPPASDHRTAASQLGPGSSSDGAPAPSSLDSDSVPQYRTSYSLSKFITPQISRILGKKTFHLSPEFFSVLFVAESSAEMSTLIVTTVCSGYVFCSRLSLSDSFELSHQDTLQIPQDSVTVPSYVSAMYTEGVGVQVFILQDVGDSGDEEGGAPSEPGLSSAATIQALNFPTARGESLQFGSDFLFRLPHEYCPEVLGLGSTDTSTCCFTSSGVSINLDAKFVRSLYSGVKSSNVSVRVICDILKKASTEVQEGGSWESVRRQIKGIEKEGGLDEAVQIISQEMRDGKNEACSTSFDFLRDKLSRLESLVAFLHHSSLYQRLERSRTSLSNDAEMVCSSKAIWGLRNDMEKRGEACESLTEAMEGLEEGCGSILKVLWQLHSKVASDKGDGDGAGCGNNDMGSGEGSSDLSVSDVSTSIVVALGAALKRREERRELYSTCQPSESTSAAPEPWNTSEECKELLIKQLELIEVKCSEDLDGGTSNDDDGYAASQAQTAIVENLTAFLLSSFSARGNSSTKSSAYGRAMAVSIRLLRKFSSEDVALKVSVEQNYFPGICSICSANPEGMSNLKELISVKSDPRFSKFVIDYFAERGQDADVLDLGLACPEMLKQYLELHPTNSWINSARNGDFESAASNLMEVSQGAELLRDKKSLLSLAKLSAFAAGHDDDVKVATDRLSVVYSQEMIEGADSEGPADAKAKSAREIAVQAAEVLRSEACKDRVMYTMVGLATAKAADTSGEVQQGEALAAKIWEASVQGEGSAWSRIASLLSVKADADQIKAIVRQTAFYNAVKAYKQHDTDTFQLHGSAGTQRLQTLIADIGDDAIGKAVRMACELARVELQTEEQA